MGTKFMSMGPKIKRKGILSGHLLPLRHYLVVALACTGAGLTAQYCSNGAAGSDVTGARTSVKKEAVAAYSQKINDVLNKDWAFTVQLYETSKKSDYVVRMAFEEMREVDTVHFPDLGYPIRPAVQKGPDSLSCYIGFLDPNGQFMYYKGVWVEKNTLNIRTVRKYKTTDE